MGHPLAVARRGSTVRLGRPVHHGIRLPRRPSIFHQFDSIFTPSKAEPVVRRCRIGFAILRPEHVQNLACRSTDSRRGHPAVRRATRIWLDLARSRLTFSQKKRIWCGDALTSRCTPPAAHRRSLRTSREIENPYSSISRSISP